MGRGLLGESRRSISFQTRPPPGQLLGEEFSEYSNIYTNIFVVFWIFQVFHIFQVGFGLPLAPSLTMSITFRIMFITSPTMSITSVTSTQIFYWAFVGIHGIKYILTSVRFFYTNILLLAEIFTYAILCLGAHFPFESGYSGGEGAQCRKWLGCPEESMRGVTLTGDFPH